MQIICGSLWYFYQLFERQPLTAKDHLWASDVNVSKFVAMKRYSFASWVKGEYIFCTFSFLGDFSENHAGLLQYNIKYMMLKCYLFGELTL